jgi:hypothetical protein
MEHAHDNDSLFEASCHYLNENLDHPAPSGAPEANDPPAIHACVPPTTPRTEK